MKKFLCTVAFALVASVGFSNDFSNTNEKKPVKKAKKVEAKSPKLLPVTYKITCPAAQGGATYYLVCDGCSIGNVTAYAQYLCGGGQ